MKLVLVALVTVVAAAMARPQKTELDLVRQIRALLKRSDLQGTDKWLLANPGKTYAQYVADNFGFGDTDEAPYACETVEFSCLLEGVPRCNEESAKCDQSWDCDDHSIDEHDCGFTCPDGEVEADGKWGPECHPAKKSHPAVEAELKAMLKRMEQRQQHQEQVAPEVHYFTEEALQPTPATRTVHAAKKTQRALVKQLMSLLKRSDLQGTDQWLAANPGKTYEQWAADNYGFGDTDEGPYACPTDGFSCLLDGVPRCNEESDKCDQNWTCDDHSDEAGCGFTCPDGEVEADGEWGPECHPAKRSFLDKLEALLN